MLNFYLFFSGACLLLAIIRPKLGLWLMLVVGLLADPVRKLTPGNPVYIQVVFVSILALIYLAHRKTYSRDQSLLNVFPTMRAPLQLFFVFLVINAIRPLLINMAYLPLVVYSSVQYVGLIMAAKFGFDLVKDEDTIIKFTDVFIITLLPFMISILFHFWGFDKAYPVLRVMGMEGGKWLKYYYGEAPLSMLCGLFRNPEGMGWYAMMVSVSAFFLLVRKKRSLWSMLYYIGVFILSSACVLFSGRRKFFLGVFVFILIFIILSMRKNIKKGIIYLVLFMIASGGFFYYIGRTEGSAIYLKTSKSGVEEAEDRFQSGVLGSIKWAIRRDGFFGKGLGTTAQGARHLGVAEGGSYIESGPGKVVSELGIPGFIAFVMIFLAYISGAYRKVAKGMFKDIGEVAGVFLLSLVLTNIIEFAISHQIYGDPLVAVLTGLMFGFLLAVPRIRQGKTIVHIKQEPQSNA